MWWCRVRQSQGCGGSICLKLTVSVLKFQLCFCKNLQLVLQLKVLGSAISYTCWQSSKNSELFLAVKRVRESTKHSVALGSVWAGPFLTKEKQAELTKENFSFTGIILQCTQPWWYNVKLHHCSPTGCTVFPETVEVFFTSCSSKNESNRPKLDEMPWSSVCEQVTPLVGWSTKRISHPNTFIAHK